jgi:hypothetical protein
MVFVPDCGGGQSTLVAKKRRDGEIDSLWGVMLVGSAVVLAVVLALLAVGLLRRSVRSSRWIGERGDDRCLSV